MLLSLNVKNFAIIDNIDIDFKNGMTALTGETGAGKSLIIDAIGLLFGDRASSELVRTNENKAVIEGVFCNISIEAYKFLIINNLISLDEINIIKDINDIEDVDLNNLNECISIRKEIFSNGKSVSKINGISVTTSLLNEFSLYLGNIHTQFDTIKLINPKYYFDYIDNDEIKLLLNDYKENLKQYNKYLKEYNQKKNSENELIARIDYLKYQLDELIKANLNISEEEELLKKYNILKNHEKIFANYKDFVKYIDDNELLDNLYSAISSLSKNQEFDENIKNKTEKLNNCYYEIEDILNEIHNIINHDEFDESELDYINERLSLYQNLKRKYKSDTSQLIQYRDKITKEIEEIENFDFYIEDLKIKKDEYYNKTLNIGKNITEIRKKSALSLEKNLYNNLLDLELKNVNLKIEVSDLEVFNQNGMNNVDILVSFNKGETLKPLAKVASGGELSRFMLALKSVTCTNLKTYIFDEIDTGVSGEIAQKIGEKIKKISLNNQVICVTHLPQVAAICDNHLFISKEINNDNNTSTNISELSFDERVNSIALMLSKGNVTDASKALALELLNK